MEELFNYQISKEGDNNYYIRRNGIVMHCSRQKVPLNTVTAEGQGITYTFCNSNCPLFDVHSNMKKGLTKSESKDESQYPFIGQSVHVFISCGSETRKFPAEIIASPEPKPAVAVNNKDKSKAVIPTGKGGEA